MACYGYIAIFVCTPMGFVRLFGVVGQVLVKPNLLRDVNEEFHAFNIEEATVKRKLANVNLNIELRNVTTIDLTPAKLCSGLDDLYQIKNTAEGTASESAKLFARLRELESERKVLEKQRSSSALQRNLVYPIAMLLLLILTGITVLLVVQNTLELLIGIKAVPLSTRQFTLGITSLSKLGPLGATLEVCIITYLGVTSAVGLYTMPFMRNVRPRRRKTSLTQLIFNCGLVLILSSALPLLARILGITNFDLLGDFGEIEWLGNFMIVLLYNVVFGTAATLCLFNKFTATVRRELCARLVENYFIFLSYLTFMIN
ncbi:lipocalin-1 interacting membrane receptor (limr) [Anopheles darlingi]|uniref:Lipocalin-1 interacting membrane receptor (Limr) n=1 Tax=Anopheles darlingi TaxID=43151 RepID=W5J515_ANODA|nr:lipocalin-1 interacting membrane receptor (limr) [Anopheles darlingi]